MLREARGGVERAELQDARRETERDRGEDEVAEQVDVLQEDRQDLSDDRNRKPGTVRSACIRCDSVIR